MIYRSHGGASLTAIKARSFWATNTRSHPISAMINYCVVVEAGRLARALAGEGMALQIGFLHSDKHGRNSLVWDASSRCGRRSMRACSRSSPLASLAGPTFRRAAIKTHRIARPIIAELLEQCLLPERDILDAAAWLRDLVMRYGAPLPRIGRGRAALLRVPRGPTAMPA